MRDKDSAAKSGGSGLLTAGIVIAIAIAAGSYVMLREDVQPTEEELAALVKPESTAPTTAPEQTARSTAATGNKSALDTPTPPSPTEPSPQTAEPSSEPEAGSASGATEVAGDAPAPSIDEVRLDADGLAVIAGRAAPGARVDVLVDGDVVATAQADGSGAFAAVGVVSASEQARLLSLRAERDGVATVSRDEVILAPLPAQAEPPVEQVASARDDGAATDGVPTAQPQDGASIEEQATEFAAMPSAQTGATETPNTSNDASARSDARVADAEDISDDESLSAVPETVVEAPQAPQAEPAPEPAAPQIALLKSDEEGVSLLQSAPEPPGRIVLDTIGYSDSGVVELAGRASSDAVEIRVYLDNRVVTTLPVETAGNWRGEVPDVDTGVYTLRMDELNAEGRVTSRLETPFKREAPAVLAAATEARDGSVKAVTVQAGDTLWAIARDRYGEGVLYVRVFEANRSAIRDPDLIYPGQVFDLPAD